METYKTKRPSQNLFEQKYAANVKRQKVSDPEQEYIRKFIGDQCPTKSGSPNDRNYLWMTKERLYHAYCRTSESPRSYEYFMHHFKEMRVNVRAGYWGSFDCPICTPETRLNPPASAVADHENANVLAKHKELIKIQLAAYKDQKASIQWGELVLVLDFTKIYLDSSKNSVCEILVVVALRRRGDSVLTEYYDFMCADTDTRTNDFFFVREALHLMFLSPDWSEFRGLTNRVKIWSDGGPHHFKTNSHLDYLRDLAVETGMQFIHNYFPSYHGHSLADGHAGVLKRSHKKANVLAEGEQLKGDYTIKSIQTVQQLKEFMETNIKSTKITLFEKIDRNPALRKVIRNCDKIDQIKQVHCAVISPTGHGKLYQTSFAMQLSRGTNF